MSLYGTYPSDSVSSKKKGVAVHFSTSTAMKPVSHPAVFLNTIYIPFLHLCPSSTITNYLTCRVPIDRRVISNQNSICGDLFTNTILIIFSLNLDFDFQAQWFFYVFLIFKVLLVINTYYPFAYFLFLRV